MMMVGAAFGAPNPAPPRAQGKPKIVRQDLAPTLSLSLPEAPP